MYFVQPLVVLAATIPSLLAAPAVEVEKRSSPASAADFTELQRAAKLASGAYAGCTGTAQDVTITLQLNNLLSDTQGFIGYSPSKQRIAVVMRGSTTVTDILNDIDTTLVTPSLSGVAFPSTVRIMTGVYTPWSTVHAQVITEVRRLLALYPTYTLESTGHSLGGSLTYISHIALAQNFPGNPITSNALAAFPIGNAAFAAFGSAQAGSLRRGNNFGDGVPNMYPLYTHYGTEYYGSGTAATTLKCEGQRDLTCSAGNLQVSVTLGHLTDFGVSMIGGSCTA